MHERPASPFWQQHPSIYEHVTSHIRLGEKGLAEGGEKLPDEERVAARSQFRWVAGGLDGAYSHNAYSGNAAPSDDAAWFLGAIQLYCNDPTSENKQKLHDLAVAKSIIDFIDPLLKSLSQSQSQDHLHNLAHSLAIQSPDREPVKLGVAILGLFRQPSDTIIFKTLGRHEEFTLYCAVALMNSPDPSERDLWELARNVDGWGRISVVERLTGNVNPSIKDWLLREGFRNSIMNEYLAYTCAVNGELRRALVKDDIDDGLLDSAGEIIAALLNGGPAKDINSYTDGAVVIEQYLRHLSQKARTAKQFLAVRAIRDWLTQKGEDWTRYKQQGWSPNRRAKILAETQEMLERKHWYGVVLADLQSDDEQTFYDAQNAAATLAIDTWEYHWKRLLEAPLKSGRWFYVMRDCTDDKIIDVVALAEQSLPLNIIATGPASDNGLGLKYEPHHCLDFILQDLGRFPAAGTKLVKAGLLSPVIRNRNMAVKTLSQWGKTNWPLEIETALAEALTNEPEEKVRQSIQKAIDGDGVG